MKLYFKQEMQYFYDENTEYPAFLIAMGEHCGFPFYVNYTTTSTSRTFQYRGSLYSATSIISGSSAISWMIGKMVKIFVK